MTTAIRPYASVPQFVQPILVIAHPWGGKGKLCKELVASAPRLFSHFDMGHALRLRAAADATFEPVYRQYETTLVPDPIIFETMELYSAASGAPYLLIDGVPRNLKQAMALIERCRQTPGWKTPRVWYLNASQDIAWQRFLRYPRVDRGEHLLTRAEKANRFAERTATFRDLTRPMLHALKDRLLYRRVDILPITEVDVIDRLVPQAMSLVAQN